MTTVFAQLVRKQYQKEYLLMLAGWHVHDNGVINHREG